MSFSESYR